MARMADPDERGRMRCSSGLEENATDRNVPVPRQKRGAGLVAGGPTLLVLREGVACIVIRRSKKGCNFGMHVHIFRPNLQARKDNLATQPRIASLGGAGLVQCTQQKVRTKSHK